MSKFSNSVFAGFCWAGKECCLWGLEKKSDALTGFWWAGKGDTLAGFWWAGKSCCIRVLVEAALLLGFGEQVRVVLLLGFGEQARVVSYKTKVIRTLTYFLVSPIFEDKNF